MLFKPNTVIKVAYDMKRNRIYTVDVTTGKFYSHSKNFGYTNMSVPVGMVLAGIIRSNSDRFRPDLYLDEPSNGFKILLIAMAILIGLLLFWILNRTRKKPQLEVYLQQHPQPELVKNANEGLDKALPRALLTIVFMVGFSIGSLHMFNQFLNNSNLVTYIWATALFLLFSSVTTILKSAIFILKLSIEMA